MTQNSIFYYLNYNVTLVVILKMSQNFGRNDVNSLLYNKTF